MLGRATPHGEGEGKEVPEFVEEFSRSLKGVCDDVRQNCMKHTSGINLRTVRKLLETAWP